MKIGHSIGTILSFPLLTVCVTVPDNLCLTIRPFGAVAVAQLVEVLCYKPEGRGFGSRWCHWNVFIEIALPAAL